MLETLKKQKFLFILGVILIILVVGVLGYSLYQKYKPYETLDTRYDGVFEIELEDIPTLNLNEEGDE